MQIIFLVSALQTVWPLIKTLIQDQSERPDICVSELQKLKLN